MNNGRQSHIHLMDDYIYVFRLIILALICLGSVQMKSICIKPKDFPLLF